MLSINFQEGTTDLLTLLLPLALCCMMPSMFRGQQSQPQETSESDAWFVNMGIQEAYDSIVAETETWRKKAETRKKGRFSFLSRKKPTVYEVDEAVPPRLFRVRDDRAGEISFELIEVAEGGTSVKSTYKSEARILIQNFKAKLPIMIPASTGQKVCPSCGKQMMPEFNTCPFCGTKLK